MADPLREAAAVVLSGTWSTVWPLLVLPAAGVWLVRGALRGLEEPGADPRRQIRIAALGACAPGIVGLALVAGFASRGIGPVDTFTCFAKFFGPTIVASVFLARSAGVLGLRRFRLSRLLRLAHAPSERLARIAADVGVSVRELPTSASVCFATGLRRPFVVISTGTLRHLDDPDLRAALLHERAHLRRADGFWATILTAASEFGLWPSRRALRLYRLGQEALADDEAAREVGRAEVAGVLVRFARTSARLPVGAPLAEAEGLDRRIRLLVGGDGGGPAPSGFSERAAWLRIAAVLALGAYPFAARWLSELVRACGA